MRILHSGADDGKVGVEVELLANGKVAILVKNTGKPIDPEKIKDVLVQKDRTFPPTALAFSMWPGCWKTALGTISS